MTNRLNSFSVGDTGKITGFSLTLRKEEASAILAELVV
jgi:hypothetical protein